MKTQNSIPSSENTNRVYVHRGHLVIKANFDPMLWRELERRGRYQGHSKGWTVAIGCGSQPVCPVLLASIGGKLIDPAGLLAMRRPCQCRSCQ